MRLSDSFEKTDPHNEPAVEVVARVFNVNYGKNRELLDRCRRLHGYAYLIQQVRYYTDQGLVLEAAMERAIEDCIQQNILKEFLLKHRGEVADVILTKYDAAFHIKCEKEESYAEGEQAGYERGVEQGLEQGIEHGIFAMVQDSLDDHLPPERISQKLQKHFQLTPEDAQHWILRCQDQSIDL